MRPVSLRGVCSHTGTRWTGVAGGVSPMGRGEDCRLCSPEGCHLMQARSRRAPGSHVVPVCALKGKKPEAPETMLLVLGHSQQN